MRKHVTTHKEKPPKNITNCWVFGVLCMGFVITNPVRDWPFNAYPRKIVFHLVVIRNLLPLGRIDVRVRYSMSGHLRPSLRTQHNQLSCARF